jgi:ABC-type iron transport system FetAB ATPase subunit
VNTGNERVLRIAASLGIDAALASRAHRARRQSLAREAAKLDAHLGAGGIALITGFSGSGKSTLLKLLANRPDTVSVVRLTARQRHARVVALNTRTPVKHWAQLLARFGLAEARTLVSRAADLSTGEQARLELALAAARCEALQRLREAAPAQRHTDGVAGAPPHAEDASGDRAPGTTRPCADAQASSAVPLTLLVDEWCSLLDRPTAHSVAASAARWARQHRIRLIGATAHEDLAAAINADVTIKLQGQGSSTWTRFGLNAAG